MFKWVASILILILSGCASQPSKPVEVPSLYAPMKVVIPVSAFYDCLKNSNFDKGLLEAGQLRGRFITSIGKDKGDSHFWVRTLTFDVDSQEDKDKKAISTCNEKAILETNKALSHPDKDDPVSSIEEGTIQGWGTIRPLILDGEWEFNGGRTTKFHAFYDTPPAPKALVSEK